MKSSLIIFLLLSSVCLSFSQDFSQNLSQGTLQRSYQNTILTWINTERSSIKLSVLLTDKKLKRTARLYSEELAERGILSHTDSRGGSGLIRYRENGGTSLRVGEIIGAGKSIVTIESAWLKSGTHREVILDPNWTHCGIGITRKGNSYVVVVMFTTILIKDLTVWYSGEKNKRFIKISGYFFLKYAGKIKKPLLISGVKRINADIWDPLSGKFLFLLSRKYESPFLLIGYISLDGGLVFSAVMDLKATGSKLMDLKSSQKPCSP
ncbi:MAG: CAP domain-containing protein [Spirochaetales bacterium]|nr:CAP domain-containing protein [Spirochaetales bacterium]